MLSSHPEGDRPEISVPNGDILLVKSFLQLVVVGVGELDRYKPDKTENPRP